MIGYLDFLAKRKIYANYPIYFPHIHLDINDMLSLVDMEMDISPKTVLIQEASKWFDSRSSMRKENKMLSSFTGQSGKREMDIYYDDQFANRIDSGLRDITDYSFIAERLPIHPQPAIMYRYHQYAGYFDFDLNRSIPFPAYYMQQYYSMYATREPTTSLERLKQLEKESKENRGRKSKNPYSKYMIAKYGLPKS